MQPVEIEVKFHVEEMELMRDAVNQIGAWKEGRAFENNIRFEDENNGLQLRQSLLRLRKDDGVRLTFKSNMPGGDDQFKVRQELEVGVDDFDTMKSILESLGFHQEQVYEKWRETYLIGKTEICLDTMPFGNFLEIEGGKKQIRRIADELGLDWKKRILTNYLSIFNIIKTDLDLPFLDITFDNFKSATVHMQKYLHLIEAGQS